ncbi:MAG: SET domain-containing protein-lysine N-methyltransferase [Patescibacteria group bacterium]
MQKSYLSRTWVSPKLKSGKSDIHGDGLLAKDRIIKGEKIMEFGGELISKEQSLSGNYRSRSIWIVNENKYLALPNSDTEESLDENLNHSCDANTWLKDEVTLVAKKDIENDEEITLDQGTWNFEDSSYTDSKDSCSCGAPDCRRILTENDWKIFRVQEKYKNHFHPMIQKMINSILS